MRSGSVSCEAFPMARKVRWGCLSTAHFALTKFLPALPDCEHAELFAIASRDAGKAREVAATLGIPKAHATYDELLADPDVDVVYVPLPNHLHVEWSARAAEAGKHVLCEKPIGLNAGEVRKLIAARDRCGVKIGEAFMVRTHPQWLRARELVRNGAVGRLRSLAIAFSYFNRDAANIRNIPSAGGGAAYDIGCYAINVSRFLFGEEPRRVVSLVERDPEMGTDRLTSAILDFPSGQSVWTVSTQLVPYQTVQILGTEARIELQIPFNAPNDSPCKLFIDDGSQLGGASARTEEFPIRDQYTIEADAFSRAVLDNTTEPVPLEDSLENVMVLDAVYRSGESGRWENLPVA